MQLRRKERTVKLTDVSVAGEPIKQSIMVQRLEINFSEETKEFLLKALQAQPIVRCKDCRHGETMKPKLAGRITAVFCHKNKKERFMLENDYCSYGQRKG